MRRVDGILIDRKLGVIPRRRVGLMSRSKAALNQIIRTLDHEVGDSTFQLHD